MSTTKKANLPPIGPKLAGQAVAVVLPPGYFESTAERLKELARAAGARVVDPERRAPDLVVVGGLTSGRTPREVLRIRKKYPQVRVLDENGFHQLLAPTADEFLGYLRSGPHGYEFWDAVRQRVEWGGTRLDLSGADLRNLDLSHALLHVADVDSADFRGATLRHATFDKVREAVFDGADLTDARLIDAEGCSLRGVDMTGAHVNPAVYQRCDFTGARLARWSAPYTRAVECTFRKADLTGARLDHSDLTGCDFRAANLSGADLHKCRLDGCTFARADLAKADLRDATLAGADLTKADLRGAVLSGADLTDARVDGTDFTGANLTGVTVAGLDPAKARNLVVRAPRPVGPNMRELARVAKASKKFQTSVRLDLGGDGHVDLHPALRRYGSQTYLETRYTHESPTGGLGSYVDAPTFEQGMLNLADLWDRGKPDLASVTVEAKQCPLRGAELRDLAVAAWCEALGLPVPSAEEMNQRQEQAVSRAASLREVLLGELTGGAAGVKKWNARLDTERQKIGKLRRYDFSGAKLARAHLFQLDLEGTRFDRASLTRAVVCHCRLRQASFKGANLSGANLAGSKAAEASFEGATLARCNLRAASFRRANFRGADLTKADFSFSDLCGADFTGATLAGVEFARTKFDDKTVFPPGFVPPDGLEWKGAGPRPGTAPAAAARPGRLDFDGLLAELANSVEAARLAKATSMLKAERFRLFADVTADALVGVVKSQSAKDRVYSCRLAADGAFACCTQNLKPCGGLRGAVCKHLLVLALGLAKAGAIDPGTVAGWLAASKAHKPAIDPDRMTEAFLKYKGAEAGEVDWRPTETIPEDFYAM